MAAMPKGPTGKPKRIGLAQMLGLPTLAEKALPTHPKPNPNPNPNPNPSP